MSQLEFLHPELLFLAAICLPVIALLWHLNYQARLKARLRYGEARLVDLYSRPLSRRERLFALALWVGAFSSIITAAAGPTMPQAQTTVPVGSAQVVAVWDVSKSMLAEDEYRPFLTRAYSPPQGRSAVNSNTSAPPPAGSGPFGNRIDMVRHVVINQLMPAMNGSELGVVTYSGEGWVQAEIMSDFAAMRWVLDNWVKAGSAPGSGSDYAEGIKTAAALFRESKKSDDFERVIVLFSDGGYTGSANGLAEALKLLNDQRVRLIVVGLGDVSPVPLPEYNSQGFRTGYMKDDDGATANAALEEESLVELAARAGGTYFRLDSTTQLDIQWAAMLSGSRSEKRNQDLYQYPLAVALIFLTVVFLRGLLRKER